MKKVLAFILTLTLCLSLLPAAALTGYASDTAATKVTVFDGSEKNEYIPVRRYYNYGKSQTIVPASDLKSLSGKSITDISYYSTGTGYDVKLDIYLTETSLDSLTGLVSVSESDKVFSGKVFFESDKETRITLDTPFDYSGSNLLVTVINNTGSYGSGLYFYGVSDTNASYYSCRDGSAYDSTYTEPSNTQSFRPKMTFCSNVIYRLYVSGKQVTGENANDILGNGTVSYDPKTNTLTLENATVDNNTAGDYGYGIQYTGTGTFTVKVIGNCTAGASAVQVNSSAGIAVGTPGEYTSAMPQANLVIDLEECATLTASSYKAEGGYFPSCYGVVNGYDGDILIKGSGKLVGSGGNAVYSYGISSFNNLAITDSVTVQAEGADGVFFSAGLAANNALEINGGTVTATGGVSDIEDAESYGITGNPSWTDTININGGTLTAAGNTSALGEAPILANGVTAGGSVNYDGSSETVYVADNNADYKWFTSPYNGAVINFDAGGGSGEMEAVNLDSAGEYTLPECTFTAPDGFEFDRWDIGETGETVNVFGIVTLTAQWWKGFPDSKSGSWYYNAVKYCSKNGYINGYQNGNFGPNDNLKRQDFVVILANIAKADLSKYQNTTSKLKDVKKGAYYAAAVNWAVDNNIIAGYQNGNFGVNDNITREQVATILYRYMSSPSVSDADSTLAKFSDAGRVSSFAKTAVAWAVQNEVISGMADGRVAPTEGASRAQIASIIMRMDRQGMFDKG